MDDKSNNVHDKGRPLIRSENMTETGKIDGNIEVIDSDELIVKSDNNSILQKDKELNKLTAMNTMDAFKMVQRNIIKEVDEGNPPIILKDHMDLKSRIPPKIQRPQHFIDVSSKEQLNYSINDEEKTGKDDNSEQLFIISDYTLNKVVDNVEAKRIKSESFKDQKSDDRFPPPLESSLSHINLEVNKSSEESNKSKRTEEMKFMDLFIKYEWIILEQLLRSYGKDNPLPNFKDSETGETPLMIACRENRLVIVNRLLELDVNINEKAKDDRTALHYAAKFSKEDIMKMILSKKPDANVSDNITKCLPIHFACGRPTITRRTICNLLKITRNGRLQTDIKEMIPLIYAVDSHCITTVKELLEKETEAQLRLKEKINGDTALHRACRKKNIDMIHLLCETGAQIDIQNNAGQTPFHISVEMNDEAAVKYLFSLKPNEAIVDNMGRSALFMAAERGNTKIVEFLIDKLKYNIFTRDKEGNTLLHVTCHSGFQDTTISLLTRGVPLHTPNRLGLVCLHVAAEKGHVNIVRLLLDKGANVNGKTKDLFTCLHLAVKFRHPIIVDTLIGYGADVNAKGGNLEESPLHISPTIQGGEICAEILIKSGVNVNQITKEGETALHISAKEGNLELLKSLLNAEADPTVPCEKGNTVLHNAVQFCHYLIVLELINFIKSSKIYDISKLINFPNENGETTLHLASNLTKDRVHFEFEEIKIMRILLESGGDIKIITDLTQETPLHYCAASGNSEILTEIIIFLKDNIQKEINKQAKNGWSPLLFASDNGHYESAKILLKNNSRVDIFDDNGLTALHLASRKGFTIVANLLLSHKAFVNAKSKDGLTSLHLAAKNGFREIAQKLVNEYNAIVDPKTFNNKTPLHLAAEYGQKALCESLLRDLNHTADANAKDSKGQTPIHLAAANDHSEVVKLFLQFRSDLLIQTNFEDMTCVHLAASNGSLSVVKEILKFDKSIIHFMKNSVTKSTPLHLAAQGGHLNIVKVLMEAGADPSEENNDGMTCLHVAAKYGHTKLINCFKQKLDLKIVSNKTGMTPLHIAAHYGQIAFVREILAYVPADLKSEFPKADERSKDESTQTGLTALHLSARSGHENLVRLLLNCVEIEVNSPASNGMLALHLAAMNGHTNVTSLLLNKLLSQISEKDYKGRTCLHLAAYNAHLNMVELLIGQGAEINETDNMGFTPLHYAAKFGCLEVCKLLVKSGAKCEKETNDFKIPLIFAASLNHTDVVSFLLRNNSYSIDKLMEDNKFLQDLMVCSKLNNFKTIEEFILLSEVPAESAAKLSKLYNELSKKEKERSKDLSDIARHCEDMCTDLVALAALDKGANNLLKALDCRKVPFLDILIETEQKNVISHPIIQQYLSNVWTGNLDWPSWKFLILFFLFIIFPLFWLIPVFSKGKTLFKVPVIKFSVYLFSHMYLTAFLFVALNDWYPCYRKSRIPTWNEFVILIWILELFVSELLNHIDWKNIGVLRIIIVIFGFISILIHVSSIFYPIEALSEILYIRNQMIGLATFLCILVSLEFLSFHHLFGPWTIIMRNLMIDLFRFVVFFAVFLIAFACMLSCTFQPTRIPMSNETVYNIFDMSVLLYYSLYGLIGPNDVPTSQTLPSYAQYLTKAVYSLSLLTNIIVLINLLIAMMTDTYQRIQAKSDIEWKFGRAQLIINMKRRSPTPPPFTLIYHCIAYLSTLYYRIQNIPVPIFSDNDVEDNQTKYRKRSQISPNPIMEVKNFKNGSEHIKEVVNWPNIVQQYIINQNNNIDITDFYNATEHLEK